MNVAEYIDASIRTRRMNVGARMEDLQIFGITKDPTLALRYQLDGKVRGQFKVWRPLLMNSSSLGASKCD